MSSQTSVARACGATWMRGLHVSSPARRSGWFEEDADDARAWLIRHGVIDANGRITGRRRE